MSNPNQPSIIPLYNTAAEMMADEVKSLTNVIQNGIFQDPRQTYPEERFRKYFAPFFLGVYEVPADHNLLNLWVSEVGSYMTEVDIVDPSGVTLFIVPPIYNTSGININYNATHPLRFNGLENIYKADAMNNPEAARVDYYNGISMKLGSMFKGFSPDPTHIDKWLKIFAYYNVTPPVPENARIVPVQQSANTTTGKQGVWGGDQQLNFEPTFD